MLFRSALDLQVTRSGHLVKPFCSDFRCNSVKSFDVLLTYGKVQRAKWLFHPWISLGPVLDLFSNFVDKGKGLNCIQLPTSKLQDNNDKTIWNPGRDVC